NHLGLNVLTLHLPTLDLDRLSVAMPETAEDGTKVLAPAVMAQLLDADVVLLDESRRAKERSEEHTSELQSRFELVCRLLRGKTTAAAPAQVRRGRRKHPARPPTRPNCTPTWTGGSTPPAAPPSRPASPSTRSLRPPWPPGNA